MNKLAFSLAVAMATAAAVPASAAIYDITSIEDGGLPGFGFSLFHSQSGGPMSGGKIEDPDASTLASGGFWNSSTGEISFGFDLEDGGSVSAAGDLDLSAGDDFVAASGPVSAVGGYIDMTFSGLTTNIATGTYRMFFGAGLQSGPANGVDSLGFMSLWGDRDNWYSGCSAPECFGVDLRLGMSPAPVPLPAAGWLLVAGMGGLGAMRKLRKKS